jgi:iron(III) transport system substrate-binding protein
LILAAGLVLAGCGSSTSDESSSATSGAGTGLAERDSANLPPNWDEVVAAAQKEGQVIVYTNDDLVVTDKLYAAFNEAFPGITIQPVRDSVDVLATKYVNERESTGKSPADILQSTQFAAIAVDHPDWFKDLSKLPKDEIPTMADFTKNAFPEGAPAQVTSAAYIRAVGYNTDKVSEEDVPKSWCDLANPKYKGRLVMQNPAVSSSPMYQDYVLSRECPDLLAGLVANGVALNDSPTAIGQAVAAGQYDFGFLLAASQSAEIRSKGAPLKLAFPENPTLIGGTLSSFPADPPNPNAARVFATFLLSSQAQEIQCEFGELSSLNKLAGGACAKTPIPDNGVQSIGSLNDEAKRQQVLNALGLK